MRALGGVVFWTACVGFVLGCSGGKAQPIGSTGSSTGTTTGGTILDAGSDDPIPYTRASAPNPIVAENQKPGDWDWYISQDSPNHEIEGYASDVSVEAGESLDVMVSTSVPSDFTYAVYRLGWYGGDGARKVQVGPTLHGQPGPACPRDATTNRVECDWPVSFTLSIPGEWLSGVYFIKLHRADGFERYVSFTVRDHRAADVLFKVSVNTDQAYNRWGGESLYFDSSGTSPSGMGFEISFDRPFDDGAGTYSILWWEQHALRFLEQYGYDVSYGTSLDAYRFDGFYKGIGAIVTAGHDEYWTQRERDVINGVLAGGQTSLVNLTANPAYWRVRYSPDGHGKPHRRMSCYKAEQQLDPFGAGDNTTTAMFRLTPNAQPENGVFGTMYEDWMLMGYPLIINDVSNPLFNGTGFHAGDQVPQVVGYEYDKVFDNGLTPPNTTVLASSPVLNAEAFPSTSQVVVRTTPQGRVVFSAGSIYWPLALSNQANWQDSRVQKLTWNVMEAALAHRHTPRPPPDIPFVTHDDPPPVQRLATSISAFAGKAGLLKRVDGPAQQAGFASPTGLAVDSRGTVYVADTTANVIRMISGGNVTTFAGDGVDGDQNGPANQARFRWPTGLAIVPDHALYVADSDNHEIRRIDLTAPGNPVTTYAGVDNRHGGYADGPGDQAYFNRPTSIAFGPQGQLYVADEENNLIRVIAHDAAHTVSTFAGTWNGYADGPALTAAFNFPTAVATGPDGTVYVLDTGNALLRRIKPSSNPTVDTIAGQLDMFGCVDGSGDQALLRGQMGLLWMPSGVLWADGSSNKIRQIVDGTSASTSNVTTFAGNGLEGTTISSPGLSNISVPAGLAVGPHGEVYVSDTANGVVRQLVP